MVWYIAALDYFWNDLLLHWLNTIFIAPFNTPDMLWIVVPVWLSWFFAEFFQEKAGTSMGNAISNATIVIWAAVDCARQTVKFISAGEITLGFDIFMRFLIISLILIYGLLVLVLGLKGNPLVRKIGRIREMTYIFAIFVPVFYNEILLTFNHLVSALLFFPVFYYFIELLDKLTPDPAAIKIDMESDRQAISKKEAEDLAQQQAMATSPVQSSSPTSPSTPSSPQQGTQQPRQTAISPLLSNRRKGGSFWDFKL